MASFISELKRRNVFKVAMAYAIVAWLITQVVVALENALPIPDWFDTVVVVLLMIGFPVALIFAWVFELTPEGITVDADNNTYNASQKLNYVIIALLSIAVIFMFIDNYILGREPVFTDKVSVEEVNETITETEHELISDNFSRSIAVLPFENRSAREEDEFFVAGIHDEILTILSRISSLRVISRTSVMEYRDSPKNIRTIGEELGVGTILEGGVQRAGDKVQISVQLIDANNDDHIWADTYNREFTAVNIFEIQNQMATEIATAMQAKLTPQEVAKLSKLPTQNTRAYDFYLSGKEYDRRGGRRERPLAIQQYQQAVEEDPNFALARAELAVEHLRMYQTGMDQTDERINIAKEEIDLALEIEPDLPEAHLAMGRYYNIVLGDYSSAKREFEIAEQGMPFDPELLAVQAINYRSLGDWDQALALQERGIELDPRNITLLRNHANTHLLMRNYTEAERYFNRAIEIRPDRGASYLQKAWIPLLRDGDVTAIREINENSPVDFGDEILWDQWYVAVYYDREYENAHKLLDELTHDMIDLARGITYKLSGQVDLARQQFESGRMKIETELQTDPDNFRLYSFLGESLAGLGEKDAAILAVEKAFELIPFSESSVRVNYDLEAVLRVFLPIGAFDRSLNFLDYYFSVPGGRWSIEGLLPDARLDPIRDDPRFVALVEKYKRQ